MKDWNTIYGRLCLSFDEMHEFLTFGPRLATIAEKYGLKYEKLRVLHRKIFDASVIKNRQTDSESPGGMFLEPEGIGIWSYEKATVGVRRIFEGEDPEEVAKDIGYSASFLQKMELNLMRHIMEVTLDLTFDDPRNDFPMLLRKWAAGHEIEVDF